MFYENKPDTFIISEGLTMQQYPLHLHQYIEIAHLEKGLLEMQIGSKKYCLHPGDIAVSFPNVAHDYHALSEPEDTQLTVLNCYPDFLPVHKRILFAKRPSSPLIPAGMIHDDVFYAERRLFELNPQEDNGALVSSLCSLMLCRLIPQLHLEDIQSDPQDNINSVVAYIAEHYREDISLSSIASHFGIGKYTLSRIFSNVLHCNFSTYMNSLRISYSRVLLVNTDMNITSIALESGFNNQQTFNRVFKEVEGCTPKEYRKIHTELVFDPFFL